MADKNEENVSYTSADGLSCTKHEILRRYCHNFGRRFDNVGSELRGVKVNSEKLARRYCIMQRKRFIIPALPAGRRVFYRGDMIS